jgi:hypothetical protein
MRSERKPIYTVLLLALAISFATLTGYLLSILWLGEWKYRELLAPIFGAAIAVVASAAVVAVMYKGRRNLLTVACLTAVIVAASGVVATGLFFGFLGNCNLSCGTKIEAESTSPSGHWRVFF